MTQPVRLIPLLCPHCQTPIPAQPDEVAWVCTNCQKGLLLDESQGAVPLNIFFHAGLSAGKTGAPFWVTRGRVVFQQRETYRGNEEKAMQAFWAEPRLFAIPAYALPLEEAIALGVKFLQQPLKMEAGKPAPFLPMVVSPQDVHPLAEFIVMSIEAERKDALRRLTFTLSLEPLQCWILPV